MTRTQVWCESRIIEELGINANFWANQTNFFLIQPDKRGMAKRLAAHVRVLALKYVMRIMYIMLNIGKG